MFRSQLAQENEFYEEIDGENQPKLKLDEYIDPSSEENQLQSKVYVLNDEIIVKERQKEIRKELAKKVEEEVGSIESDDDHAFIEYS